MIEPIENNETGLSVREKLNKLIDLTDGPIAVEFVLSATTVDDTLTELFVEDESDFRMTVPTDTAWVFEIFLVAYPGSGAGVGTPFVGAWRITGTILNDDGTVTLGPNWDATNPSYSTGGKWDPAKAQAPVVTVTVISGDTSNTFGNPTVDADVANVSLRLRVEAPGYTAQEIHWAAKVRITAVTFNVP